MWKMENGEVVKNISPKWKRPQEVMKLHKLRQKKRALSARINGHDNVSNFNFSQSSNSEDSIEFPAAKKRNPFIRSSDKNNFRASESSESGVETDISSDITLFQILSNSQKTHVTEKTPISFANILQHLNQNERVQNKNSVPVPVPVPVVVKQKDGLEIPIDWSLKSKITLMSPTPFLFTENLRTCEQASSITGFVRCLDTSQMKEKNVGFLDTSPNARFHQSCLYWQHPNLPWIELFPRSLKKLNGSVICTQLEMAPTLLKEWTISFKSLLQLVRTRQCPFFYLIGNNFYCLFRAAGMGGINEVHAMINPTTRGFRKMLDDEGVQYSMPLKKKRKSNEFASDLESQLTDENKEASQDFDTDDDDDDDDDDDKWLESMSLDTNKMKKIYSFQKSLERKKEEEVDGSAESLLLIEGSNVQAFFNALLNYKACVAISGPFAGIPPTLIAPTAFSLAALKSCQIRDRLFHLHGTDLYSIQIEGPILPHALRQICMLLEEYKIEYTGVLTTVKQSSSLTQASIKVHENDSRNSCSSNVFLKENLSDCGLSQTLINVFCDDDPRKYDVVSNIQSKKGNDLEHDCQ